MTTKAQAQELFNKLDTSLADLTETVTKIASTKAWAILGHVSLGEALGDRLTILTPAARSTLVAALVGAGVPGTEILEIRGVTPVAVLAAMQLAGKAPKTEASGVTRTNDATRIQVSLSVERRNRYAAVAKSRGLSLGDFVLAAIEHEVAAMAQST